MRNTSLLLIIVTFVAGLGLGWMLHDLSTRRAPVPAATPVVLVATPTMLPATATALPLPTNTALPLIPTTAIPTLAVPTPEPTWLPTLAVPTPEPTWLPTLTSVPAVQTANLPGNPTAIPSLDEYQIEGFSAHIVAENEDLQSVADQGGSSPMAILLYNKLISGVRPGQPLIVPRLVGQTSQLRNPPVLVERGNAARPYVALTLDAGASAAPVPRMLQTLRERGVRITFFLTGKWIRENPELTRQIVADGHEIANHTSTHPDLRKLSDAEIRAELADTEAAMREIAGVGTRPFFRPPYGAYDDRVLQVVQEAGYLSIYWTLDSLDSVGEPKTAEFLVDRVTARLSPEQLPGAIILAHCGSEATADALPTILDRFDALGLSVRPVSEVLAR